MMNSHLSAFTTLYSIEWKLALNKPVVVSDTEQNLVLAPRAYWNKFLKILLWRLFSTTCRLDRWKRARVEAQESQKTLT